MHQATTETAEKGAEELRGRVDAHGGALARPMHGLGDQRWKARLEQVEGDEHHYQGRDQAGERTAGEK